MREMFRPSRKDDRKSPPVKLLSATATKTPQGPKKTTSQSDSQRKTFLENENGSNPSMLIATPIRVAMASHHSKQNYNVSDNNNSIASRHKENTHKSATCASKDEDNNVIRGYSSEVQKINFPLSTSTLSSQLSKIKGASSSKDQKSNFTLSTSSSSSHVAKVKEASSSKDQRSNYPLSTSYSSSQVAKLKGVSSSKDQKNNFPISTSSSSSQLAKLKRASSSSKDQKSNHPLSTSSSSSQVAKLKGASLSKDQKSNYPLTTSSSSSQVSQPQRAASSKDQRNSHPLSTSSSSNKAPDGVTLRKDQRSSHPLSTSFSSNKVYDGVTLRAKANSRTSPNGHKLPMKRSSDSIRRGSGHQYRRTNSMDYSKKRNSDPVTLTAFASGMMSLKAIFAIGGGTSAAIGRQNTFVAPGKENEKSPAVKLTSKSQGVPQTTFYTDFANDAKEERQLPAQAEPHKESKSRPLKESRPSRSPLKSPFGMSVKKKLFTPRGNKEIAASSSGVGDMDQVEGGSEKKWARSNSLRRPFHRGRENNAHSHHHHHHHHHQDQPGAHSDTEIGKISAPHSLLDGECSSVGGGSVTSERGIDVGRVAAWATSFEKLLEDPAGLHTFAEFLKKEYSHENIYFWTACERYKRLSRPEELQATAKAIFERHLCVGASEPVNVDSQARQDAQDSLRDPNEFLFSQAQKQIFNLMKFDSYSRFLKSALYQDCLGRDMRGQTLPYPGDETLDPDLRIIQDDSPVTLKKSKSDADERRRKSLLPWHRKDRSKSKDRGEAEYRRQKKMGHRNQSDSSSVRSDMSGSRTSLNSVSDLVLGGRRAISKESLTSGELGSLSGSEGYNRCRVILPDLSNSVVAVRHGDTVQELLTRLLERRGIAFSTFDVYQNKTDKLIERNEDSGALGGLEVRIEQRILFSLDLPNRKTVCVKAKPNKLTSEVLKPILHKYGYKMDLMAVHKIGEEKSIPLKAPVNEIDGEKLVVQTKEEVKEWGIEPARHKRRGGGGGGSNTLDEITNRVFEDLLRGKSQQNFDELGILDFDARSSRTENSSDQSSGITGGFDLRNSLPSEKDPNGNPLSRKKPLPGTASSRSRRSLHDGLGSGRGGGIPRRGGGMMAPPGCCPPSEDEEVGVDDPHHHHHLLISKRRGGGAGNGGNPAQPLVNAKQENDELYEGLKRAQRSRLDDQRGTEINFELPDFLKCHQPPQDDDDEDEDKENQLDVHLTDVQLLAHLECPSSSSPSDGEGIPTSTHQEDYFSMAHPEVWGGGVGGGGGHHSANTTLMAPEDLDLDDFDDTLVADAMSPHSCMDPTRGGDDGFSPLGPSLSVENPAVVVTSAPPPVSMFIPPPSLQLSPPPPLPPKPKIGGTRGPPPRPPSRQLPPPHLLNPPPVGGTFSASSTSDDDGGIIPPSSDHPQPHLHLGRQTLHDKFNISFV